MINITHYNEIDNPLQEQILDLIEEYDDSFSDFKMSFSEMAKQNLFESPVKETVSSREAIKLFYESEFNHVVVAVKDNEEVVGLKIVDTITETDDTLLENAPTFYPCMRYTYELIQEDYRDQGLYTRMLEYTEENLLPKHKDHNHAAYFLTGPENTSMIQAGKSNGFELIETVPNDRENKEDTHIYIKEYDDYTEYASTALEN